MFLFADEVRCQWNKSWSSIPTCEPVSCNLPPEVSHGRPIHQSSLPSFVPYPISNPGLEEDPTEDMFHASGDSISLHYAADANMTLPSSNQTKELNQRQRRYLTSNPESFAVKTSGFVFGDLVHYECDPGHQHNATRPDSIVCGANGQWSSPRPICELVSCTPPPRM